MASGNSEQFVEGYIRAKMDQLEEIRSKVVGRLYNQRELGEIGEEVNGIRRSVARQVEMTRTSNIDRLLVEYRKLSIEISKARYKDKERNERLAVVLRSISPKRWSAVDWDTFPKEKGKPEEASALGGSTTSVKEIQVATRTPVAMGRLPSAVIRSNNFVPMGRKSDRRSPGRNKGAVPAQYLSAPQTRATGPQKGVAYPPMAYALPYPLPRDNSRVIGYSEIFTSTKGDHGRCVLCEGSHKMYRCQRMMELGLGERWRLALSKGVCLHCLYPRHSSFTCSEPGACKRCGTRHNSVLCPKNPGNRG